MYLFSSNSLHVRPIDGCKVQILGVKVIKINKGQGGPEML